MPIWLCSQPKKMHLDSRWTPENHLDSGGVHLEYVGQGKVLPHPSKHPTHNGDLLDQMKGVSESPKPRQPRKSVMVEGVEDEAFIAQRDKPKSPRHLLVPMDEEDDVAEQSLRENVSAPLDQKEAHLTSAMDQDYRQPPLDTFPPPLPDSKPTRLCKKRQTTPGLSAVGISVLSTKGWVGGLENSKVDLQLDSCADVTLVFEDFYKSLKGAPSMQQGMKMQLWQLTHKDESLRGFIRIPIFMETTTGEIVESEAEAYVVPRMMVPILLGEDYQLNYEVGVTRNVETGTKDQFRGNDIRSACHEGGKNTRLW